jgi:hypothetical protein
VAPPNSLPEADRTENTRACNESPPNRARSTRHDWLRPPFDPDSPYWIVPNAFALARRLGIDQSEILAIVAV